MNQILKRTLPVLLAILLFGIGSSQELPIHTFLSVGAAESAEAAQREIDLGAASQLSQSQTTSTKRIVVTLDVDFVPEGDLGSTAAVRQQRSAINSAQNSVFSAMNGQNASLVAKFKYIPAITMEVDEAALEKLLKHAKVKSIMEDEAVPATLASSIPVIGADVAWAAGYTGAGQTVAILDTGVDKTHPFFTTGGNKVVSEACYSSNVPGQSFSVCPGGVQESTAIGSGIDCTAAASGNPGAILDCRHGTHVAGIAAGNDGGANVGVARDANIIAIQVFSIFPGSDSALTWTSDQIKGLERVYELRDTYNIASANMSLGGSQHFAPCGSDLRNAIINTLASVGIATVISSGNNGFRTSVGAPGCVPGAITVGATEDDDDVATFSNIASFIDLLAPGVNIDSAVPGISTSSFNGTSMAAPHVAGAWAVMKQQVPNASVDEVRTSLYETGTSVDDQRVGGSVTDMRRINLDLALSALRLSASPSVQSVCVPSAATFDITVETFAAVPAQVTLSTLNLPSGATASFSVNPITPNGTSVLTINTAGVAPGNYTITVEGTDGSAFNSITVDLNVSTGLPSAVSLTAPTNGAVDVAVVPLLEWNGVANADSYGIQIATDSAFTSIIYSAIGTGASHQLDQLLDPETLYYWRVRPQNACGAGNYSVAYSFTTESVPPILLVDDDDNNPNVQSFYTDILDSLVGAQGYNIWDTNNSDNEPNALTLAPYNSVIWFSGDELGSFAGPGTNGEAALAEFLDRGNRCFFISSQDYHWDKGLTGFMQDYLGVNFVINDTQKSSVAGQGGIYGGLGPYPLTYPFTDFSDTLFAAPGAAVAFSGNNGTAAVSKGTADYKSTFLGYPLETVPMADRADILQVFLDWCASSQLVESELSALMGQSLGGFSYNSDPTTYALGVLSIDFVFTSGSSDPLYNMNLVISTATHSTVINADGGPGGVGSTMTIPNGTLPGGNLRFDLNEDLHVQFDIGIDAVPWAVNFDLYGTDGEVSAASIDEPLYSFTVSSDMIDVDYSQSDQVQDDQVELEPMIFLPVMP
ncbi:MAG: S8 family serine peptidase [Chloroflexota bacterium]